MAAINPKSIKMDLVICPGCGESFTPEERIAFTEWGVAETKHFTDPLGRLFCCAECFEANG